jgi:hypothetical protein
MEPQPSWRLRFHLRRNGLDRRALGSILVSAPAGPVFFLKIFNGGNEFLGRRPCILAESLALVRVRDSMNSTKSCPHFRARGPCILAEAKSAPAPKPPVA